jgi:hypothetical protein
VVLDGRFIRVARPEGDKYESLTDPASVMGALRSCSLRVDLFTFMQVLPDTTPLYRYAMEWDNLAALPVMSYDHWFTKQVDRKVRNIVRKAEKAGVTVREVPFDDTLVQGISNIYNESRIRRGVTFKHYGKDLETVRRENGTFLSRSVFLGAFLDARLIGFAKLVADQKGGQASLMQIVSLIQHRAKAPNNALIAEAVRSCAVRNIPFLIYSNFSYGRKTRDSLSDFKEHNGFRRVEVPRYYVPLSNVGRLALALRLHRPANYYLPEALQERFRAMRTSWNARRHHVA